MMETIAAVATDPPTLDEVARARTRILQGMETRMANSQQAALGLSETIAAGDWRLVLRQLRPGQSGHAGGSRPRRHGSTSRRPTARSAISSRRRTPIGPTCPRPSISIRSCATTRPGCRSRPAKPSIRRPPTSRSASCARPLQNGMKLVMLSKATRGDTVSATIQLRFGDEKSLAGLRATAELTGALLGRGTLTQDAPAAAGRDAEAERPHHRHRRRRTRLGHH